MRSAESLKDPPVQSKQRHTFDSGPRWTQQQHPLAIDLNLCSAPTTGMGDVHLLMEKIVDNTVIAGS